MTSPFEPITTAVVSRVSAGASRDESSLEEFNRKNRWDRYVKWAKFRTANPLYERFSDDQLGRFFHEEDGFGH